MQTARLPRCALAPLALAALLLSAAGAQAPDPVPPPARDRAGRRLGVHIDPQQLAIGFMTLKNLLATAYGLQSYQISGPAWMDSERFDVTAETAAPVARDQMLALLRPFLTEQFHLQLRQTTTMTAAYALVAAPGGLKIKPGRLKIELPPGHAPLHSAQGEILHDLPPGAQIVAILPGGFHYESTETMVQLAYALTRYADRPVVDATGMRGNYPISLKFAATVKMGAPPPRAGEAPVPAPRPFSALRQQLGLQLVARTMPITKLTVERALPLPSGR
ncbi:MAG: TIGR03435 family protein [Terriglobales bacterium]